MQKKGYIKLDCLIKDKTTQVIEKFIEKKEK